MAFVELCLRDIGVNCRRGRRRLRLRMAWPISPSRTAATLSSFCWIPNASCELQTNPYAQGVRGVLAPGGHSLLFRPGWSFFEEWVRYGLALVEDCTFPYLPSDHPLRYQWMEVAGSAGLTQKRAPKPVLQFRLCRASCQPAARASHSGIANRGGASLWI
jgi:hypothetical protein